MGCPWVSVTGCCERSRRAPSCITFNDGLALFKTVHVERDEGLSACACIRSGLVIELGTGVELGALAGGSEAASGQATRRWAGHSCRS